MKRATSISGQERLVWASDDKSIGKIQANPHETARGKLPLFAK